MVSVLISKIKISSIEIGIGIVKPRVGRVLVLISIIELSGIGIGIGIA